MEILIEIAKKMNELLEADDMDNAVLEEICQTLKEQTNVRFRLMDFKFFNKERLALINAQKIEFVRKQNFKAAANKRDLELKCLKHIQAKEQFKIKKSMFDIEENIFAYFYTGTAKNDRKIYSRLTSPGNGFFENPLLAW